MTVIKVVNIVSGFAIQKRFVAVHSVMNKATGALLFLLPLTISAVPLKYSAIVVCAVAMFAAIQLLYCVCVRYIRKATLETTAILSRTETERVLIRALKQGTDESDAE